jgi:hypothetical protein
MKEIIINTEKVKLDLNLHFLTFKTSSGSHKFSTSNEESNYFPISYRLFNSFYLCKPNLPGFDRMERHCLR